MRRGSTTVVFILLFAATVAPGPVQGESHTARFVPGLEREDLLAAARYDWNVSEAPGHVDLTAVPHDPELAEIAARFDTTRGSVEAVYAAPTDGVLSPVFHIGTIPLLIAFDPPLPLGSGLRTVSPLHLAWANASIEVRLADAGYIVTSHANITLPANGTSPAPGSPDPSGARLEWRIGVVPAAIPDPASGLRSPATIRSTWALVLPDGVGAGHRATWSLLLDGRTQNHGTRIDAAAQGGFDGIYMERGAHRAAYRVLAARADVTKEGLEPEGERAWRIFDLVRGPIPTGETVLLPMQMVANTTATLSEATGVAADVIVLELAFYQAAAAAGPGDGAAPLGGFPGAPQWWQIAAVLLLALLVVAPPGRRGRATKA